MTEVEIIETGNFHQSDDNDN